VLRVRLFLGLVAFSELFCRWLCL